MSDRLFPNSRILLVDDEALNVDLLAKMLGRAGYVNVASTTDSGKVMQIVRTFEPDLIVLDLHMPEPDGFALMGELEETVARDEFLPVLVLTADATEITKVQALSKGATDFLTKPFQYPELLLRLQNLLTIRHQEQELLRANRSMATTIEEQAEAASVSRERGRSITLRTEAVLASPGPEMLFQPIVDIGDGTIIGAEALARFPQPPDIETEDWFREAHEVELGVQLELSALAAALRQIDNIPTDCYLACNISPEAIRSPALRYALTSVPTDRLVFELTEQRPIHDYAELRDSIADLRERGIRLAVDDTGSGYASMNHILELRPEIVKLDRSVIQDLDTSPVRRSLVAALHHFSTEFDVALVAEGIETMEELETLKTMGIRLGQGFVLANPAPLPLSLDHSPGG